MKPHPPRFGVLINAADRVEFVSWVATRAAAEAELFGLRAAGKEALLVGELAPWVAIDKPVPPSVK
jgi:hypothetical protein